MHWWETHCLLRNTVHLHDSEMRRRRLVISWRLLPLMLHGAESALMACVKPLLSATIPC